MLNSLQPKVAVVILNYNTKELLEKFLPSVIATNYSNAEIWVVDNGSSDDSAQLVKDKFPKVQLLVSNENRGFAGGYQWALGQIKSDFYVLLNSDVQVEENWLNPMVEWAIRDEKIGAIQPKILDAKDKSMFEYAGASGGFLDKWGYPFCRGRLFDTLEKDEGQYNEPIRVFWATGAAMFIRAEAYHNSGGLDQDFFAHMEEIDLCWRLQKMGFTIGVQPMSVVYHVGGGTLAEGSARKYFLNYRNNLWLLSKNLVSPFWFLVIVWRMVLDGVSGLKFIFDGKPRLFFTILKAHGAYWISLPAVLKKRKEVKRLGKSTGTLFPTSVVWDYFVKGKKKFSQL